MMSYAAVSVKIGRVVHASIASSVFREFTSFERSSDQLRKEGKPPGGRCIPGRAIAHISAGEAASCLSEASSPVVSQFSRGFVVDGSTSEYS
jgi:hypothetical protein